MHVKTLALPLVAALVVGAVALSLGHSRGGSAGARSGGVVAGKGTELTIANYAFAPPVLTVRVGTAITVRNVDSTAHTATAKAGAFDSGTLKTGQSAHFTLNKPGTYSFYCQFHAFMSGSIKVIP